MNWIKPADKYGNPLPTYNPFKGVSEYVSKLTATDFMINEIKQYLEQHETPIRASAQYARDKCKNLGEGYINPGATWSKFHQTEQMFFLKTIHEKQLVITT